MVGGEGFAVDASVVRADANYDKAIKRDDDDDWPRPSGSSRAVREYLEALDEGHKPAKRISTTDPAAQWTAAPGGPAFYAYSTNYLIDTDAGIIVDVEATTAHRSREVESTKAMIDRVERRFALKPERLIGDTAYGTAEMLAWMVDEKDIEPHVPVWDRGERDDGTFSRGRPISLSGWQGAQALPPQLQESPHRDHEGWRDQVSRPQARLRSLPTEAAVLS
jgi:hypothetical protein